MKKFLFLLLSAAVAISASAGANLQNLKKLPNTLKESKTDYLQKKSPIKTVDFTVRNNHVDLNQRSRGASDVINDQPEGTLKTYTRSEEGLCTAYADSLGYYYQSGDVNIVYDDDGQTVWIQDIICYLDFGTWVKGTISGNKITVPLGQFISWNDNYNYGRILAWGTLDSESGTFTVDESVTEVTYTINGDVISLDNSSFDEDTFNMTGLTSIWNDDLSWGSFMECLTVLNIKIDISISNLTVEPGSTTADVTWDADEDAEGYDLRYRPYTEGGLGEYTLWDFNGSDPNAIVEDINNSGWMILDNDGDDDFWGLGYGLDDDDYCLVSYSYGSSGALTPDNWMITPEVKLDGVLKFSIWGSSSYPETMEVYACVGTPTSLSDFEQIGETVYTTTGSKTEYTIDLSAFAGQTGCFAFRHYGTTDMYYLKLDDIFVGTPGPEPAPWNYITSLETNECTIEGLTPETKYEVQVMGYNGDNEGDWCGIVEFTTLPDVPDVYMLGGDDQGWDCTSGKKFEYNAEDNLYTLHYTFPAETNNFGFTTRLAENNDQGGWDYIEPYRFGAVAEEGTNFIYYDDLYDGKPLDLTWDEYHSFQIGAGEYDITVDLTSMKVILKKVVPAHDYEVGDVNHDHAVNIGDVTALIDYLLGSGSVCETCANVNGDEGINIGDVTALIDKLLNNN